MTKRLDVTARQVEAICLGAEKAGHIPVIEIGNLLVRLIPASQIPNSPIIDTKRKGYL